MIWYIVFKYHSVDECCEKKLLILKFTIIYFVWEQINLYIIFTYIYSVPFFLIHFLFQIKVYLKNKINVVINEVLNLY